jgi:hypothetical protein
MAESDWFILERHIEIINMILVIGFPICLASYLPAILEAKFGEAKLLLIVVFRALVHMLPPLFHNDAKVFC